MKRKKFVLGDTVDPKDTGEEGIPTDRSRYCSGAQTSYRAEGALIKNP